MDVRIVEKDADHSVAVWHQTVIEIWRGAATVHGSSKMVEICEDLIARSRGPVTFIAVLEPNSPPPPDPVRRVLARWSRDVVPKMAAAVMVAEGSGFRTAIVRAVGVTLTTLVPHRVPFKFHATVESALDELAPHLPPGSGGATALRQAIDDLRAEMAKL